MTKLFRRISAVILVMAMLIGVLPLQVMAEGETVNTSETTYESLEAGKEYTVNIEENGVKEVWYQFTPAESGYYTVYANGDYDSYCELYDSNKIELAYDDDSNGSSDFKLQYELAAGATYYYNFRLYNVNDFGSYKVNFIKNVPGTAIKLNFEKLNVYVGTDVTLKADFEPELAVIEEISWTSSDEKIARVNENGEVDILSEGNVVITAASESGLTAKCTINVKPAVDAVEGTTYTITTDGESTLGAMYKFVPEKSGYYSFYSFNGECDTEGTLYDAYFNQLKYDDQSGESGHFAIDYKLEAGETYYINVGPYDSEDKISFDFKIREITPTVIKNAYFTVDNEKKEEFGFSTTEANEVTLWFELSVGDDIEISNMEWRGNRIDQNRNLESIYLTVEYDKDKGLYYTKVPSSYFVDGSELFVDELYLYSNRGECRIIDSYNGEPVNNIYYLMGENSITKTYDVHFNVNGEYSEASVTSSRITSLAEMGIELPTVPVVDGAEFIGWELIIGGTAMDIIKLNDERVDLTKLFEGEYTTSIELKAKYDKRIVKGDFSYIDKNGESVELSIDTLIDENRDITVSQWLDYVLSENLLGDIEHTPAMAFEGWEVIYIDPEYLINEPYYVVDVEAKYSFDGIILGGVHIKDGDYLNNAGEVSKTMPEGGYGYYADGKLTLHDYNYEGDGSNMLDEPCALYARGDLEIILEGKNNLCCISDDVIYQEDGNLTISGDGMLNIRTYGDYDGIDMNNGDLTIKKGTVIIEVGDHGCEVEGAVTIDGGIISITAGDEGFDLDDDFTLNDGIINIVADDIGIDSSDNIYVKNGFLSIVSDDDGFEASDNVVIDGGSIVINSNKYGIYSGDILTVNNGVIKVSSKYYAFTALAGIALSEQMEAHGVIIDEDGKYVLCSNGEIAYDVMLKTNESAFVNFIENKWVVLSDEKYAYTGEAVNPTLTITDANTGTVLVENTDYTLSWSADEINETGKYIVVITGIGNYSGTIIKSIEVYKDIVFIGDVEVKQGCWLVNGATQVSGTKPETDGYAYYNDGILELNNFKYEGEGYIYDDEGYNAVIFSQRGLSINLIGDNTLVNTSEQSDGIVAYEAVDIYGDGSLDIKAEYGIGCFGGDITIDSGSILINAENDAIGGG